MKILEINGRISPSSASIYRQCLSNGDPYKALIDICCDRRPENPIPNGLLGGTFILQTFGNYRAENLLDFELANQMKDVNVRVKKEQCIAVESDSGCNLATVNIVGKKYQEILAKANIIRHQLLKQPELSPTE
ncbi:MAG: hypothetical protein AB4352_21670 [Hormoscilla sp.]